MSDAPGHAVPEDLADSTVTATDARPGAPEPLGSGLVIAIDGPSGSGKSSVSRAVARHLGLRYLDTGAMYRALAWWCLERGLDLRDAGAVAAAVHDLPLSLGVDPQDPHVHVAGQDIGEAIRSSAISSVVSAVATNLAVRECLVARQRALILEASHGPGIVAEGRDITTVVAPDAPVRVLLVANERARMRRRARQLHGAAGDELEEATRDEVVRRDRDDSTVAEFATAAPGVTLLDNSALSFEESVDAVLALVGRPRSRP